MTNRYLEKIAEVQNPTLNAVGKGAVAGGASYGFLINKNHVAAGNLIKELSALQKQGLTPDKATSSRLYKMELMNPKLGRQLNKHRLGAAAVAAGGLGLMAYAHRKKTNVE